MTRPSQVRSEIVGGSWLCSTTQTLLERRTGCWHVTGDAAGGCGADTAGYWG